MSDLTPTALTERHRELGAKLVDFAGWEMPLEYTGEHGGTLTEHQAVRDSVGVFDVSHLGTAFVTGNGAEDAIAATFTNDPTSLEDGQSQYTLCADDNGGICDDLIVYRLGPRRWMVIPNAANTGTVLTALRKSADTHGATVEDVSTERAILAVQGPDAFATIRQALDLDPEDIPYLGLIETELHGEDVVVCRTGYTGEPGCELVIPNPAARPIFDALLEAGATPVGLGARDTLRLEMGYPLHGNDIDTTTSPFEARLSWAVKLDRGAFRGQEALRAKKEGGPSRRLYGLVGETRRPPRQGMTVKKDGSDVGHVTSGGYSPLAGVGIGMAYLADPIGPGDEVVVDVRGKDVPFTVAKPPFVERSPKG